jgi:hypothetical protein
MMLSDRTLAEQLTAALRRRGLFQLWARRLGPRDVVTISARGFDAAGRPFAVRGEAEDLEHALVAMLEAADKAIADSAAEAEADHQRAAAARAAREARQAARDARRAADACAQAELERESRQRQLARQAERNEMALDLVRRDGRVSVQSLAAALGGPADEARDLAAGTLQGLALAGALRRAKNREYTLPPDAGDPAGAGVTSGTSEPVSA